MSRIELLLPAKDLSTGKTAINHGADAVYIGASAFGARQAAGNSLHDIEELVRYAHLYGSKVHVTVNTLLYDNELEGARELLWELYNIGADAVLVQDLGLLKLDIPPIALHASTQCHNHSVERIQFLEKLGFTRAVLARETDLETIQKIHNQTNIELEAFVHGALCVCYSGQCYISRMMTGRSGNRGECAQICRTRFDLQDANGKTLIRNKHLLSLKDMCRADYIEAMLKAGIVSFKVEGRLKNESYVKNVTAFYRQRLDAILQGYPEYQRVSSGATRFFFTPDLHKTFNREYTPYFIDGNREIIASFDTPKAIGEPVGALIQRNGKYYVEPQYSKTSSLSSPDRGKKLGSAIVNGDGLCFINADGELEGFLVNGVEGNRIIPQKPLSSFSKVALYRNIDKNFEKVLSGKTAERKIAVDVLFEELADGVRLTMTDEDGCTATVEEKVEYAEAQQPEKMAETLRTLLAKLGNTPFAVRNISIPKCTVFLRAGFVNELKGRVVERLCADRVTYFHPQDILLKYCPEPLFQHADYLRNITNKAHKFVYEDFGAKEIEYGLDKTEAYTGKTVMTCKYCLRNELGWCSRNPSEKCPSQPLYLVSGRFRFRLEFDCGKCEMRVMAVK
ncbi:MAG: U32 family peptidase [Bacteroidales bacterium]|nr:U32 family peptidase [Bacteroidales bacterium]